jgi:hypothetical protein
MDELGDGHRMDGFTTLNCGAPMAEYLIATEQAARMMMAILKASESAWTMILD